MISQSAKVKRQSQWYKLLFTFFLFLFITHNSFAGAVKEVNYPSGLKVIIKEDHSMPSAAIQVWVKTGSSFEDDTISGISHLVEHMVFKGTQKYKGEQIYSEVERIGAVINAGTSKDFTYFYITLPTRLKEYFTENLAWQLGQDALTTSVDVLSQMTRYAVFSDTQLEIEKLVIEEEIDRKSDDPGSLIWDEFYSVLYKGSGYEKPVLGTKLSVRSITRRHILDYYSRNYASGNIVITAVGDFKEGLFLNLVEKFFDTKGKNVRRQHKENLMFADVTDKVKEIKKPVNIAYLLTGIQGPDVSDKDCYAFDVLAAILGKGRYSRLYRLMREDKKIVWDVNASFATQKEKGPFYIFARCDKNNIPETKKTIISEINKIRDGEIPEEDLKRAKILFESEFLLDFETYPGEAFNLGYYGTIGSYKTALGYLDNIKKVTVSDIKIVLQKYFDANKFVWVSISQ